MAGLSAKESHDLARHLKALTSRWDVSVLLVEHDMDVVFGISDAVTVFELGRVIASGDPATVRADARVREAYLGVPHDCLAHIGRCGCVLRRRPHPAPPEPACGRR